MYIKINIKCSNTKVHYLKTDRIVENNRGLPGTCKHRNKTIYCCELIKKDYLTKTHFNQYSYKVKTPTRFYKINIQRLS